ncbi:hypothetical protein K458DRAFT_424613 [Lentithecium fluviatile CBS 122367]|uniref:Uncharacterized protein n=1 Tax=Lentithecium fluviatile CBS 122367 TaxID=1168545 RepID=A0A6G1IEJ0_9PLEO|nr:hypothetical protein K458DRAFT_424613 [Lentithecium fluviatile CBS 122367]
MDPSNNPYLSKRDLPGVGEPSRYQAYPGPGRSSPAGSEPRPPFVGDPSQPGSILGGIDPSQARSKLRKSTLFNPHNDSLQREPDSKVSFSRAPSRPPPPVPLPNLNGFSSESNDEARSEAPPLSMGGMERALPTESESLPDGNSSSVSDDYTTVGGNADRHGDAKERFKKGLEVIAYIKEKSSYAEDASQIIMRLHVAADRRLKRSYVSGRPARDYYESAPVIKVGIVFLPGVDKPTVTQLEQEMLMADYKPDQLSAVWRVNTAGHLLFDFEVTKDLRVVAKDLTPDVLENSRRREERSLSSFIPGQQTGTLTVASKERLPTVNIDSEHVTLVHDLRYYAGQFDLESTLIEVDYSSMARLLVNFQLIIQNRNAAQDLDETRNLLEDMMEDVRRLCNRSAILFRMSTRMKIISSKDIRYGVNNGREFTTLTTSKGIRKIISLSSAYYTSLDPADKVQQLLKPRFLQMLVLLLSLLNDDDLHNIREFLERTFHFNADRRNLELLFLKVIPFYSINAHIFLTSIVPAFEGWSPRKPDNQDHSFYWETFITRIAAHGYILAGTIDCLCRAQKSWIVQWPEKGFKDSLSFRNLQYSAPDGMRTFNEIPPIERDYDRHNDNTLLNAILTDDRRYMIRVADYEAIICLTRGVYSIQESDINGQRYDLFIEEGHLNQATYNAVDQINQVIRKVNQWITGFKTSSSLRRRDSIIGMRVSRNRRPDVEMIEELRVTGRLARFRAVLGNLDLAIAYKLDGRKITLEDALATLARDNQVIQSVIDYYQNRLEKYAEWFAPEQLRQITHTLNTVTHDISTAEAFRQNISNDPTISDEPIVTLIEPPGGSYYAAPIWHDYRVSLTTGNLLTIEAKKSYVADVQWHQELAIYLQGDANLYVVAPLEYVEERDREDQVRVGDVAVLAGQYLVLAEPVEDEGSDGLIMSNYLKILRVEQGVRVSKRQQRRMQGGGVAMSRSVFV